MAKNTRELFSTDGTFTYTWAAGSNHPQLTGEALQTDTQTQVEGTIFLNAVDDIGSNALTVTAQLRLSPNGVAERWGVEHALLDKSSTPTNTFNASAGSGGSFEANLYEQSWWSPNHATRLLVSRTTDRQVIVIGYGVIQ